MRQRLSKSAVRNSQPDPERVLFLWDTDQVGLGLRITPAGAKSYVFSYSLPGWRSPKRMTVGRIDGLTLEQARLRVRDLRAKVAVGVDPGVEVEEQRSAPSVQDLIERFLADHVEAKLRPSTRRAYRQILLALPRSFRQLRIEEVTGDHVARLHSSMRRKPYLANRTLAVVRKMFGLAERWHLRPRGSNPATGHDPYPERKDRGARLTDDELGRVGAVLRRLEAEGFNPFAVALVRMNLYTGWRPVEVRSLCWSDVDLDRRVVTLREAKTGTRSGFLGQSTVEILASLSREGGSGFCFPGRREGQPLTEPKRLWERLREEAELPEAVRFYDLVRHTYNTIAQEVGVPPEMVQVLVGHVPQSISARYTHFALERALEAADRAAEAMRERLEGRASS